MRDHGSEEFGGRIPECFVHRSATAQSVALTTNMTIDSLHGHDGFNSTKGHMGCQLFPSIFSIALEMDIVGNEFLSAFWWDMSLARTPLWHNMHLYPISTPLEFGSCDGSDRLRTVDAAEHQRNAPRTWHCGVPWTAQLGDALY